jgi:hypothetical protein
LEGCDYKWWAFAFKQDFSKSFWDKGLSNNAFQIELGKSKLRIGVGLILNVSQGRYIYTYPTFDNAPAIYKPIEFREMVSVLYGSISTNIKGLYLSLRFGGIAISDAFGDRRPVPSYFDISVIKKFKIKIPDPDN